MRMSKYYSIEAATNVEEYISVKNGMKKYERSCQMSELQFLSTDPITVFKILFMTKESLLYLTD